ncbi:MAG: hypothetical protein Kow0042_27220 [Calditrichia bacterium]
MFNYDKISRMMSLDVKKYFILFLPLLIGLQLLSGCTQRETGTREIVAEVGNRQIDWDHLKRSFELDPKWGKGLTREEAYQNQLNFLIDEKLFAQAGERDGMTADTTLQAYLQFIEEKELIKELYRQEVADRITITEAEYAEAYQKSKKRVKLAYIFTPDSNQADAYYQQALKVRVSGVELQHPDREHQGETPLFGYGDMEAPLEAVVFDLQQGEIAPPIAVTDGYMVVELLYGEVEKFQSELDFAERKSKIRKVMFQRRAEKISNHYIKNFMQDKNLQLNPPVFFALADKLTQIIHNKTSDNPVPVFVSNQELQSASHSLEELKREILITHRDGSMTVDQFLKQLWCMPEYLRPNLKHPKNLKNAIGVAVRNQYLAEEARRRALGSAPRARREIRIQSDELIANYWLKKQTAKIRISEEEIREFRTSEKFPQLVSELGREPDEGEIRDLIRRIRIIELKRDASDSLRQIFPVQIDTTLLRNKINKPNEVIDFQPAKVVVRELFN